MHYKNEKKGRQSFEKGVVRPMQKTHLLLLSFKYIYSQIELEGKNCSKRYIPSGVPVRKNKRIFDELPFHTFNFI